MANEIIEKLESIEWFCVGYKTYSCFVCKQLEENGHTEDCALGQAITALKAEQPTIPKSITDYIQCPDSECCGCLVKEKQTRGVVCNKCGKKWGLFPHRTNKFSKAKQPKAEEFTKELREGLNILSKIYKMPSLRNSNYQLLVNVINKSFEACDKLDSQEAELAEKDKRIEELEQLGKAEKGE